MNFIYPPIRAHTAADTLATVSPYPHMKMESNVTKKVVNVGIPIRHSHLRESYNLFDICYLLYADFKTST